MLVNQGKNLARIDFPQLDQLRQTLGEIDRLMGQAQGIDFRVDELDAQFRKLFPTNFEQLLNSDQRLAAAKQRLDSEMAYFRQTMSVQSGIVEHVREDAQKLSEIVAKSQGAEGSTAGKPTRSEKQGEGEARG